MRSLRPILASRLCVQKFRSRRRVFDGQIPVGHWEFLGYGGESDVSNPVHNYRGFNPRTSNCWLHSAGASRSRSTPMTARQTTFDRCPDEIRREERERDRHVDLTHAAFLTCCDLLNVGHRARYDLVKPTTTSCDGVDQSCPSLDPRWTNFIWSYAVRDKDLPGLSGRRLLPRN